VLTDTMRLLSFIGSAAFYIPLLVILYWCVDTRLGARAAVALLLGSTVNIWLKMLFVDPRPFWTDPSITGHEPQTSFGMPSGHAQNAMVMWGFLAAQTRRRALWAGAAALIAGIGVSRIALGVHSFGQVAAGWLVGAVILAAVLGLEARLVPGWARRSLPRQLGLSLTVGVGFAMAMWAALERLDGWRWPVTWARAIIRAGGSVEPISLEEGAAAAGVLFGILAGLSLARARIHYTVDGAPWRRLARVPVGAAGALTIYTAGLFLGTRPVQMFLVQALLGLWIAAGAPEVFIRMGLARRSPREVTQVGEERLRLRQ
jgi:membrane-associated phospholipid phosphatase